MSAAWSVLAPALIAVVPVGKSFVFVRAFLESSPLSVPIETARDFAGEADRQHFELFGRTVVTLEAELEAKLLCIYSIS